MDKNIVVEKLKRLATSDKRSETARLRDVFDEVDGALGAGVSRAALLETLHEQGFTMTLNSFESALFRLRRQRRTLISEGKAVATSAGNPAAPAASAPNDFRMPAPHVTETPSGRKITNTADTVRMRRPQIDLEEI